MIPRSSGGFNQNSASQRPIFYAVVGILACAFIACMDYLTGTEFGFSIFYLLPVILITWYVGAMAGFATAAACAAIWFILNPLMRVRPDISAGVGIWNAIIRFCFFAMSVFLVRTYASFLSERMQAQAKTKILSIVSHDLNNPLAVISMALSALEGSEPENPDARRMKSYRMIGRSTERIRQLVESLLNQARLDTGRFKLSFEKVLLRSEIKDIMDSLALMSEDKRIELHMDFPPEPLYIRADPTAMEIVMTNLISNAIKYTPNGGRVTIKVTSQAGRAAEVSVEDTGIGIHRDDQQKILSEYYRTTEARQMAKGHGLGLSIAREMIELHGGELKLESEPGRGSRFYFSVPVWSNRAKPG